MSAGLPFLAMTDSITELSSAVPPDLDQTTHKDSNEDSSTPLEPALPNTPLQRDSELRPLPPQYTASLESISSVGISPEY